MSKLHDTLNQQIREQCRACHNVCYVSADADGNAPPVPAEGFRCEGCEAAGYERYDFDKSLPRPEPPLDAGSAEGATPVANAEEPPGSSPSQEPAENAGSEARPSDEPKSAQGEQVVVSSAPPEAT